MQSVIRPYRMSMLALEPRLVFDGAAPIVSFDLNDTAHSDAVKNFPVEPVTTETHVLSATPQRHELVVIDGALEEVQTLVDSVKKADPDRTILVLDKGTDEVAALTGYLQQHAGEYDAIHILSHGGAGWISFDSVVIALDNSSTHVALWQSIKAGLTENGELLLYGCNVGASAESQAAINALATFTSADIAASTDITGVDGNWTLEYQAGTIESQTISAMDWQHDLWTTPVSPNTSLMPLSAGTSALFGNTDPNSGAVSSATSTQYNVDSTYGVLEGSWFGDMGGSLQPLTARPTYNNRANTSANLTPLDLTLGDNTGGSGIRFAVVRTNDGSVQTAIDVTSTSYAAAVTNNDYFYSTMDVNANSVGLALSYLRLNQVSNAKLLKSPLETTSSDATFGNSLTTPGTALNNTGAKLALVLYDTSTQTSTRLTASDIALDASTNVVYTSLSKVGLKPGSNYELRFYVWRTDSSATSVYLDNPMIYAQYNQAPTAAADAFTAFGSSQIAGNLISGNNGSGVDSDPENQSLTIQKINGSILTVGSAIATSNGTLTITNSNGAFTYSANSGYSGTDSFTYTITDSTGGTSTATTTITVRAPLTVDDITVNEGSPYGVFTVANASGLSITLTLTAGTATGGGTDYGSATATNLQYSLDGGTTWNNYTAAFTATLTGAGTTSGLLVRTPIVNDTVYDNGETFTLTATPVGGNAVVGTATINDDGTGKWFADTAGLTGSNLSSAVAGTDAAPAGQYLDGDMSLTVNNLVVNEGSPYAVWTVNYGAGKLVNLSLRDGASSQIQQAGVNGIANVVGDLLTFAAGHQLETSVDSGAIWSAYTAGNSVAMGADSKLLVRARINNDLPFEVSEILNLDVRGSSTTGTAFEISGTSSLAISGVTGAAALNDSASANLVQNGDFSQYTGNYFWAPLIPNPGNITAWQESGGGPRSYGTVSNAEVYFGNQNGWSMYDGTNSYPIKYDSNLFDARGFTTGNFYFRDPGNDSAGRWVAGDYGNNANPPAIAQTVQTEVGSTYRLQFTQRSEYAASLDGIAAVSINGQRVYFRVVSATDQVYTLQFTANSSNTTIQFMSWGHIWGRDELVLDNVIVNKVPVTSGTLTILDNGQGAYYNGTSASPTSAALNDDRGNSPFVSDVSVNEASPYGVFNVSGMPHAAVDLSITAGTASLASDVASITWSNDGGTSWNSNVSGATFDSSGSLLVRFSPVNDTVFEGSETFSLTATYSVAQPLGVVVTSGGSDIGLATIADNGAGQWFSSANSTGSDTAPSGMLLNDDRSISVNNISVNEVSDYAVFTVTATAGQTVSMLSLNDGTASGKGIDYGSDLEQGGPPQYQLQYSVDNGLTWNTYSVDTYLRSSTTFTVPTSVNYPTGTPGATFLVRSKIYNDSIFDNAETFSLTAVLSTGQSATGIATIYDNGTGNIFTSTGGVDLVAAKNDDRGANPVVSDVSVNEGSPYAVFAVEGLPGACLQLDLIIAAPASGKATNADLVASGIPTLQVFNGTTWVSYDAANKPAIPIDGKLFVRSAIVNDATNEVAETFSLKASYTGVGGGTANANDTGIATIVDDGTGTLFTSGNPAGGLAPTLAPATGSVVLAADAAALRNDDRPVTVTGFTVNEASPFGIFSISGAAGQYLTLSVADGTAEIDTNGSPLTDGTEDYGPNLQYFDGSAWQSYVQGSYVQIPANGTVLLVRTNIVNDSYLEGSESFTLTAANTQGASVTASGIIKDDGTGSLFGANNTTGIADAPGTNGAPASLNDDRTTQPLINSVAVNEASPYIVFTVTGYPQAGVDLTLASGSATLGADTTSISSLQVYRNGAWVPYTSANAIINSDGTLLVRLAVIQNSPAVFEGIETFGITAVYNNIGSAVGITVGGSASGTGTIRDDGLGSLFSASNVSGTPESPGTNGLPATLDSDKPSFAINDISVNETAGTMTFTVTLTGTTNVNATVDFATTNGTATTADGDYTLTSGTLTFAPGETTKTITVPITDNQVYEGTETFNVNLSNAVNATIADALGVGTITDAADMPVVSINNVSVNEAIDHFAVVTVNLSKASAMPVSFTPSLANAGTGAAYAIIGTDTENTPSGAAIEYSLDGTTWLSAASGVTIPAGTTSVQLRSAIKMNDGISEQTETYTILTNSLTMGSGGSAVTLSSVTGTVSIVDNPTMSISNVTVNEGSPYAVVQVSLSTPASSAITFTPALSNGTGTAGTDTGAGIEYFNGVSWVSAAGGVTIAQGGTGVLLRTSITSDTLDETSEVVNISTGSATNVLNASGVTGTITILDHGAGDWFSATNNTATPDAIVPANGAIANPATDRILDDDRPLTVNNIAVNEASPYLVWTVGGAQGQYVKLMTASGSASVGTDTGASLEYWNGSTWTAYTTGTFVKIPGANAGSAGNLLVRMQVITDPVYEGSETLTLSATNAGLASVAGTGTIRDDGRGDIYLATNQTGGADPLGSPGAPTRLDDDRTGPALVPSGSHEIPRTPIDVHAFARETNAALHVLNAVNYGRETAAAMSTSGISGRTMYEDTGALLCIGHELDETDLLISKFDRETDPNLFVLKAVRSARIDAQNAQMPAFAIQSGLLRASGLENPSMAILKVGQAEDVAPKYPELAEHLPARTDTESDAARALRLNHALTTGDSSREEPAKQSRGQFSFSQQLQMAAENRRLVKPIPKQTAASL